MNTKDILNNPNIINPNLTNKQLKILTALLISKTHKNVSSIDYKSQGSSK